MTLFEAVGSSLQIVEETLCEAVDLRAGERVLDVAWGRGSPAIAQALPFDDGAFDVVLSTFGVMFAPDHGAAAREILRVCRPGGRIGLASWRPNGFIGALRHLVARHLPPAAGSLPATLWGNSEHVATLFGNAVASMHVSHREVHFFYETPRHFVETFRAYFEPMSEEFAALDPAGKETLEGDLEALVRTYDRGRDSVVIPADFLEVVAVRR